jgi:maltose-binding protein MalE
MKYGKKYTKLFAIVAALVLCAVCLTACGSSASSVSEAASSSTATEETVTSEAQATADTASIDTIFDTLLAANPISNQFEIADMNIEYDFMLNKEDILAYKGVKSNDNGDAGLVLVLNVDESKAQSIVETLETYREDQVAFYGNYAEFADAQNNVRNSIIDAGNGYVVMVIASNECTDADGLTTVVNFAL